jgi:hypothetical protein
MSGVSGGNELALGFSLGSNLGLSGFLCTALIRRRVMYNQTKLVVFQKPRGNRIEE